MSESSATPEVELARKPEPPQPEPSPWDRPPTPSIDDGAEDLERRHKHFVSKGGM